MQKKFDLSDILTSFILGFCTAIIIAAVISAQL